MSKSYTFRGKPTPEWTSYDYGSDFRERPSHRGYSTGRESQYKSEFELDGSLSRRSTFYSPPRLSPRSSRAFLAAKAAALGLPRSGLVSDWPRDIGSPATVRNHPSSREPSYVGTDVDDVQGTCEKRSSSNAAAQDSAAPASKEESKHHRDLKRKMVFDLHREIQKPIHTTHLEEISDMDRITDICFNNLRVMMENKKHRKFLHHMNNNALVSNNLEAAGGKDFTNNSYKPHFSSAIGVGGRQELKSTTNAKRMAMDSSLARRASIRPPEMIQVVSPLDPTKLRGPKNNMISYNSGKRLLRGQKPTGQQLSVEPSTTVRRVSIQKEEAASFLNELQDQLDQSKKEVTAAPRTHKQVPLLSPEEALQIHWLRLNQDQVRFLEQKIRDNGTDPGIHCHMNVDNFDVFSEIRRIRTKNQEGSISEKDDEEVDSSAPKIQEDQVRGTNTVGPPHKKTVHESPSKKYQIKPTKNH